MSCSAGPIVFISSCILATGCSIAVWLLDDTWDIGWNCLGGGIQYLLPTMIEPKSGWLRVD